MALGRSIPEPLLRPAQPEDLDHVREIFLEYADWVGDAICLETFRQELAELPGRYAPPHGRLLLAFAGDRLAGCVALRQLTPETAELKRLYIRPAFQGAGLGKALMLLAIEEARIIGYTLLRLDTLPRMESAIKMYRALRFHQIPPYADNPPFALCFELELVT